MRRPEGQYNGAVTPPTRATARTTASPAPLQDRRFISSSTISGTASSADLAACWCSEMAAVPKSVCSAGRYRMASRIAKRATTTNSRRFENRAHLPNSLHGTAGAKGAQELFHHQHPKGGVSGVCEAAVRLLLIGKDTQGHPSREAPNHCHACEEIPVDQLRLRALSMIIKKGSSAIWILLAKSHRITRLGPPPSAARTAEYLCWRARSPATIRQAWAHSAPPLSGGVKDGLASGRCSGCVVDVY